MRSRLEVSSLVMRVKAGRSARVAKTASQPILKADSSLWRITKTRINDAPHPTKPLVGDVLDTLKDRSNQAIATDTTTNPGHRLHFEKERDCPEARYYDAKEVSHVKDASLLRTIA